MELNLKQIKAYYEQLQGYLAQTPERKEVPSLDADLGKIYNEVVDKLVTITNNDDLKIYKVDIRRGQSFDGYSGSDYVDNIIYRQKLNGLINYLHATYFENEHLPFGNSGTGPVITNNQFQTVNTYVSVAVDITSLIDKQLTESSNTPEEKTFLTKLKDLIKQTDNVIVLFTKIVLLAKELNVSVDFLAKLFNK